MGILRARPCLPAAQLRAALGVSPATLMRMVRAAGDEVLVIGRARRTRYVVRRVFRGSRAALPVFQIDEQGGYGELGVLDLACPQGCVLRFSVPTEWPLAAMMHDGWFEGIPYFMRDLRPEGFLGGRFALAHGPALQLGANPAEWSDDEVLHALALFGADQSGNLIVGEEALRVWLERLQRGVSPIPEGALASAYVERAQLAMGQGVARALVGGGFPKFTALRVHHDAPAHVLVKFTGSDDAPDTRRWSDLLVCEYLAGQILAAELEVRSAETRLLRAADRTFLEVTRFDRHGLYGRSALCSWAALNQGWFGLGTRPWPMVAEKLRERGLIDADTARAIERLWYFGCLIGNDELHDANLAFQPRAGSLDSNSSASSAPRHINSNQASPEPTRPAWTGSAGARSDQPFPSLRLAPVYDMLPMQYAPRNGMELAPVFRPQLPLPTARESWRQAARAARRFWIRAAEDTRISESFREICADNLRILEDLMALASATAVD